MGPLSKIRLKDGRANLEVGKRSFAVSRPEGGDATAMCPVDLIIGALGS